MVSVIIVNWNGKHHLAECLDSLRNQTFKDLEVILVDNGSEDGSGDFVQKNYPEVRLIWLDRNYGFCKANNIAIEQAKGEYIVLLNNDTKADARWLEFINDSFSKYPEAGVCASKIVYYDQPELLDSAGDGFSVCGAGYKKGHLQGAELFNKQEFVFGGCGAALAFRKAVLGDIGLLDEDFFAIYEDTDICFRAQLVGYKCLFVPEAVVYHKVNSTLGKMSRFYVYNGQRNAEYVYFKNMPSALIWKTLPVHILYNVMAFCFFLAKGRGGSFIKAKVHFLRDLPGILQKRKEIQRSMRVSPEYIYSLLEKRWMTTRIKGKFKSAI